MSATVIPHHIKDDSGLEHLIALMQLKELIRKHLQYGVRKHSKTPSEVLDTCSTRLHRARGFAKPGAAGLLIGVECSRIRGGTWTIYYPLVTNRSELGLVGTEENYSTVLE